MNRNEALKQLPRKIKVHITETRYGAVLVTPVSDTVKELISATNEHDHNYDLLLQDNQDVYWFLESYPKARYRINKSDADIYGAHHIGRYFYLVNDGIEFYMDSWEYRHMVGGQSD